MRAAEQSCPPHVNVVNVTQAPYGAKGDGVTDDSEAQQRALYENVGQHRDLSILRLKDNTFTNAAKPETIMASGPFLFGAEKGREASSGDGAGSHDGGGQGAPGESHV